MTAPMDADRTMLEYFTARSTTTAPDGLLEAALTVVGETRQRPGWRTTEWWLPSARADRLTWHGRRVAVVAVVGLLAAVLLTLAVLAGTGHPLPPPIGPARPGAIVMEVGGDIYLADPDGGNRVKLYGGPHWDGHATFSPDGTKIAFESALDDKSKSLMVMRADGTAPTTLVPKLNIVDDFIVWSPDSHQIAISATRFDDSGGAMFPTPDARIFVGDVEHGTSALLGGVFGHDPQWSPDGTMLAFGRTSSDADGVYLMRPDGSDLRPLSSVPGGGAPVWSPDGKRIAFLAPGVGDEADLHLINADGTDEQQLTNGPEGESFPIWSPDGTKIAFARMLDSGNRGQLEILDVDDGQITALKGALVTHDQPVWSPDGAHILTYIFTRPDNPDHVSGYDTLGIFDVTNASAPVMVSVPGLRTASWQRLAP
jgi:TolB protein